MKSSLHVIFKWIIHSTEYLHWKHTSLFDILMLEQWYVEPTDGWEWVNSVISKYLGVQCSEAACNRMGW